jgi:hypothetical protein
MKTLQLCDVITIFCSEVQGIVVQPRIIMKALDICDVIGTFLD